MSRWLPPDEFRRKCVYDKSVLKRVVRSRNSDLLSQSKNCLGVTQFAGKFSVGLYPRGTKNVENAKALTDFDLGFRSAEELCEVFSDERYLGYLIPYLRKFE